MAQNQLPTGGFPTGGAVPFGVAVGDVQVALRTACRVVGIALLRNEHRNAAEVGFVDVDCIIEIQRVTPSPNLHLKVFQILGIQEILRKPIDVFKRVVKLGWNV